MLLEASASPVGEDMAAGGVEGGAKGAYKGNQAQGQGIIAMLETIQCAGIPLHVHLERPESGMIQGGRQLSTSLYFSLFSLFSLRTRISRRSLRSLLEMLVPWHFSSLAALARRNAIHRAEVL